MAADSSAADSIGVPARYVSGYVPMTRDVVGTEVEPQVGQKVNISQQNQRSVPAVVADVTESAIIVDANHPLAGQDLIFDIELVEISNGGSAIIMP